MSYDLHIGDRDFNITFNVAELFYDHMPADETSERGGLHTLDGCTGKQAGDKIYQALERIARTRLDLWQEDEVGEPAFCAKYDSPNGWGSAIGGIVFLGMVMGSCYQNPRKRLSVGA